MSEVFISYSRKDTVFVRQLHNALAALNRDVWIDWEDIPLTADWWREICAGIEAANAFIFIISPDSVRSNVCRQEIEHAIVNNKRLVPILYREIDEAEDIQNTHPSINTHNWIFFRESDDFDRAFQALIAALDTDLGYVRQHTRLLIRAREWDNNKRNDSFLLRRDDLKQAEVWLAEGVTKKPAPIPLHAEYISASRADEISRQRALLSGVTAALVVSLGLALLSFMLFGEANHQRGVAEENAATAVAAQNEAENQAEQARIQAAIATREQGRAEIEAVNAQTQAAIAQKEANKNATAQAVARIEADKRAVQQAIAETAQARAEIEAVNAQNQAVIAQQNAATATVAQGLAEIQATAVADERNRAQAIALAGQAQAEMGGILPERAVLLGAAALQDYGYTWQAERALGLAVQNRLPRRALLGHGGEVFSVDWSPDSALVVTAGSDFTTRIWRAGSGELLHTLTGHSSSVSRALWSPDGARLLTAGRDGRLIVWEIVRENNGSISSRQEVVISAHSALVNMAVWSPDGSRIASASDDNTAKIWDAASGELVAELSGYTRPVNSVDWSPDGTQVVTASGDRSVRVWSAEGVEAAPLAGGHGGVVYRAAWSPDGRYIASVSGDRTAKIWDMQAAEPLTLSGHIGAITRLAWSQDGMRLLTASDDNTARVWEVGTGRLLETLFGHTSNVSGIAWSPDGARIITVSRDQSGIVWNADTGARLLTLSGHDGAVYMAAWSPDSKMIATASSDGAARLWGIWANPADLLALVQACCITRQLTDEESILFGLPPAPSLPPPGRIESCPNTLVSRLYPGVRGFVTEEGEDTSSVNVRSNPGRSFRILSQIAPGQTFRVVEGPGCEDGLAWFRIIFGINAAQGWIAEGDAEGYFVAPIAE